MNQPLVSILMTSYNSEEFIDQAIQSVLDQSYSNWELLIADDCSQDNTRDVINEFQDERIKIHHNEQNMHYLRTRNKLIQYVKGDFITLLDSDDLMDQSRIQKQIQAFENDADLGMCGTHVRLMNKKGDFFNKIEEKPTSYEEILKEIPHKNVFTGSTIMVKTQIWKELGGYRDYFNTLGYEDYDLTSRLVERYKAINLKEALYFYRQYPESSSKKDILYNPFKLHGYKLIQELMRQRKNSGTDAIEENNIPFIINFVVNLNKPYVDDQSLIYRELMWSCLNKRLLPQASKNIRRALALRPFSFKNWKTLCLYFLIRLKLLKE